jgi:hypothetical protein
MTAKVAEKKALVEEEATLLAIHHDGLSRVFASMALPHLSTRHSRYFRETLNGERKQTGRPKILEASSSSSAAGESLGSIPDWFQIHNQRCARCDNPLLLSLNCTAIKKSGCVQCMTCKATQQREEPNREGKRLYRSVRTRQSSKRARVTESVGQTAEDNRKPAIRGDAMDDEEIIVSQQPLESTPKEIKDPKTLLQQRAAELKRKSKEKKKQDGVRAQDTEETKQVPPLPPPPALSTDASIRDEGKEKQEQMVSPSKSKRKQPPSASAKQDDTLRQMLAQKRAKQQSSSSHGAGATGGLQDFLSSL